MDENGNIKPVPEGFSTITPYIVVHDAPKAIAFYTEVFDAKEHFRITDADGKKVRHAELEIGNSRILLTDIPLSPETVIPGGKDVSPVWLYVYVNDPDFLFNRAVAAGALVVTPMSDQPWGDRYGCVCDPFGYRWGIARRIANLTKDEIAERMEKAYSHDE